MKQFLIELVLPLATTLILIVVLTLALFDPVPSDTPISVPTATASGSAKPYDRAIPGPAAAPDALPSSGPVVTDEGALQVGPAREPTEMNDVMARAVRALNAARAPTNEPRGSELDPNIAPALEKLGEAVKLAREARDDKDLARAEELLRQAREQMAASCGDPSSPLCQSAERIKDLGY
jgi:hypothetical protein